MAAKKKAALNGKAEKAEQASPVKEPIAAPAAAKQLEPYQFKPGQSGNPLGRKKGSRNKLAEEFINDFYNDWLIHGASVVEQIRIEKPDVYFKGAVAILPKQVDMRVSPYENLTEDALMGEIETLAKELNTALTILKPQHRAN